MSERDNSTGRVASRNPEPEWHPKPLTRTGVTPDGIAHYSIESTDKKRKGYFHQPAVNLTDGTVDCGCENFECVKRVQAREAREDSEYLPTIGDLQWHCKHINAAIADCIRRGEIHFDIPKNPRNSRRQMDSIELQASHEQRDEQERLRIIAELKMPLTGDRVARRPDGKDYLETHDVISRLNDIFGFDGWSYNLRELAPIDATGYWKAIVTLSVKIAGQTIVREDVGFGHAQRDKPDEFDKALKSCISDGLKRCARTFGDQFGNSLYSRVQSERYESVPATRSAPHSQGTPTNFQPAPRPAPAQQNGHQNGTANGYAPPSPDQLYIQTIPPGTEQAICNQCK